MRSRPRNGPIKYMAHAKTVLFCKLIFFLFLVSAIYRHFQHFFFAAVSSLPDYTDDESPEIYTELIGKTSAGFTIVLKHRAALPKKSFLRWIFAYVVQF